MEKIEFPNGTFLDCNSVEEDDCHNGTALLESFIHKSSLHFCLNSSFVKVVIGFNICTLTKTKILD